MNKLQKELNELLQQTVAVLEEKGIDYWLAFGTVLGAERHKGFIPWDDDVDIYIDGKDYDRVVNAFSDVKNASVVLHDYQTAEGYPYIFPKTINPKTKMVEKRFRNTSYRGGIYIDIFPLFSVSKNKFARKLGQLIRYFNYSIIQAHYYDAASERRGYVKLMGKILKIFSCEAAQKRSVRRYRKGIDFNKPLVQDGSCFTDKSLHDSVHFKKFETAVFEEKEYRVPFMHIQYLTREYGDFRQLPPPEKRITPHSFELLQYSDGTTETGVL